MSDLQTLLADALADASAATRKAFASGRPMQADRAASALTLRIKSAMDEQMPDDADDLGILETYRRLNIPDRAALALNLDVQMSLMPRRMRRELASEDTVVCRRGAEGMAARLHFHLEAWQDAQNNPRRPAAPTTPGKGWH